MKKPVKKTVKKQVFKHKALRVSDALGLNEKKLLTHTALLSMSVYDKKSKVAQKLFELYNAGALNVVECMWLYHEIVHVNS